MGVSPKHRGNPELDSTDLHDPEDRSFDSDDHDLTFLLDDGDFRSTPAWTRFAQFVCRSTAPIATIIGPAADDAENAIRGGATLAGALQATNLFPDDFIGRIEIAEHSGTDAESIEYLAREYDERAKSAIKMLAGLATILIRVSVILVLVYLIFKIAATYINALDSRWRRSKRFTIGDRCEPAPLGKLCRLAMF